MRVLHQKEIVELLQLEITKREVESRTRLILIYILRYLAGWIKMFLSASCMLELNFIIQSIMSSKEHDTFSNLFSQACRGTDFLHHL